MYILFNTINVINQIPPGHGRKSMSFIYNRCSNGNYNKYKKVWKKKKILCGKYLSSGSEDKRGGIKQTSNIFMDFD